MLDRILKQYGVDKVSSRTRISKKHLTKLLEKDFEGFSKPQAYGFVSILQREYGDDFSELKMELEVWFSKEKEKEEEKKNEIFISADASRPEAKQKKWIAAVLLVIIFSAAFYFFQKRSSQPVVAEVSKKAEPVAAAEKKSEEMNESGIALAKREVQSPKKVVLEKDKTKVQKPEESVAVSSQPEPYVPAENAVITPTTNLWFGIIDLKSKKRIAKTTADPYEIESRGKKLLITGHGLFEISDSFGNLFKYKDSKKHYFLIDDGMVKEISISEFRRLNGGKVW